MLFILIGLVFLNLWWAIFSLIRTIKANKILGKQRSLQCTCRYYKNPPGEHRVLTTNIRGWYVNIQFTAHSFVDWNVCNYCLVREVSRAFLGENKTKLLFIDTKRGSYVKL